MFYADVIKPATVTWIDNNGGGGGHHGIPSLHPPPTTSSRLLEGDNEGAMYSQYFTNQYGYSYSSYSLAWRYLGMYIDCDGVNIDVTSLSSSNSTSTSSSGSSNGGKDNKKSKKKKNHAKDTKKHIQSLKKYAFALKVRHTFCTLSFENL